MTPRRRRHAPAHLAGRWAFAWAASVALFVATRTAARAPFAAVLRWLGNIAAALPAYPTTLARTVEASIAAPPLIILTLAVVAVLAAPLLIPVCAAGHIAAPWLWGDER